MQTTSLVGALRSQITFCADIAGSEQPQTSQSDVGVFADPVDDHLHDRLKMLLLSNRQSDIFEKLDVHGARLAFGVWRLAFGVRRLAFRGSRFEVRGSRFEVRGSRFEVRGSRFEVIVSLHEISLIYPKIRHSEDC